MSSEMVPIRSVKQYFNEFIVKGLEGKTKVQEIDMIDIRAKILDSFRREVFGQIIFKIGPEAAEMTTDDLADLEPVHNILVQAFRKWRRFCILCSEHGLGSFFRLDDLKNILEDQSSVMVPDMEVDVTGEVPEDTVVVDEETLQPVENDEMETVTDGNETT